MEKETKPKREFTTMEVHKELVIILDKLKRSVKENSWGAVKPSYYETTLILARKINNSKNF